MQEELKTMQERKVWELVEKPENAKVLGCRWVYTTKRGESGKIERFKARLVAQGFHQRKGETFDEVFSPVINFSLIRFFFAILVCLNHWVHLQCDVKCAYLYAPLKEEIFMSQPPGFQNSNLVCRLRKAIYGLHQSGREWFFEIHKVLNELGFVKFEWCNCAYIFQSNVILLLYVDDILLFGRNQNHVNSAVKLLKRKFDLKVLGKTARLLGVDFLETDSGLYIHQPEYISKLCEEYEKFRYPISSLPIVKGVIYSKSQCPRDESEIEEMSKIPYRNLIGSLSFLANRTRPDISYAVNIFSQFQQNPGMAHWMGLLKLLGYVKYTSNLKLNISNISNLNLSAYSDADYANNRDDRTSMGGHIIFIDRVPVTWRSFKQKSVCLSSMESEFISVTEASKELVWFQRIFKECENFKIIAQSNSIPTLLVDNRACIDFIKSPLENHRTKHIDVKLFFVRDLVYQNVFELQHIQSKRNLSDVFTKPLTKAELQRFKDSVFL